MAKKTVIISDLHLGNGGTYDIFAGAQALPALLNHYAEAGNTIFINGDSMDFLMNEDPLELKEERAVAQTERSLANPATAGVLLALGKVLAAGGAVVIRLGNHDIELALTAVQERIRAALGQPPEVAERLQFQRGDNPMVLNVGGARILVTHGEHCDPWNRVDYNNLPGPDAPVEADERNFAYGPGSRLVKTLLNPLKRKFGLRFADLIKPDFQGGVLTALAVSPRAVSTVFQGSTLKMMYQLFRQANQASNFADDDQNLGLAAAIAEANLSADEEAALKRLLEPAPTSGGLSFAEGDDPDSDSARAKLGRRGLQLYSRSQRRMAGDAGEKFFALAPDPEEWKEAQRLAEKFNVGAVVFGHTHAARFQTDAKLAYVNTGTWIWLMTLPAPDASDSEWEQFLQMFQRNPQMDPQRGPTAPLLSRFTAAVVEPEATGGAALSLIEWTDAGQEKVLGRTHVPATKEVQ